MGQEKKRSPEDGGTNAEMIFEMASGSAEKGFGPAVFIEARAAKTLVSVPVIFGEIKIVLDERSACKSVVADTVAAHPRIQERNGEEEKQEQEEQEAL